MVFYCACQNSIDVFKYDFYQFSPITRPWTSEGHLEEDSCADTQNEDEYDGNVCGGWASYHI